MEPVAKVRSAEQVAATDALAGAAVDLARTDLPPEVGARLPLLLLDLFGVTLAGARTREVAALAAAWDAPPGPARTIGSAVRTVPDVAAYLDAIASCSLELDEGNKRAAGHPAAHVVPAAVAAARARPAPVPGEVLLGAVAAGYEVAARFGWALRRDPRWHPHGHWGSTGAACAAALVHGAGRDEVAAAIDAASGLVQAAPWETVLSGDLTRHLWIAQANAAGLAAARLARAGVVENRGNAQHSLGDLAGTLDPDVLVEGLGERWLVTEGYTKRHASCSYTHAAVDAVHALRSGGGWGPDEVDRVVVRSHRLVEPLLRRDPGTRLAAMFSLPFVVASAVVNPAVDPASMDPRSEAFARARAFSERVRVELADDLDALLPDRRAVEVTVHLARGGTRAIGVPHPVGDADHLPMGTADVTAKLEALVGADDTARLVDVVDALGPSRDVVRTLDALP